MRPKGINGSSDYVKCDEISPIIPSIDLYSMCFTIFIQLEGQSVDRYIIDFSELKFKEFTLELIYININANITSMSKIVVIYIAKYYKIIEYNN